MKTSKLAKYAATLAALIATIGFSPHARAIPLIWLEGPEAGLHFSGGPISVKAFNFDTGTLYDGLTVGTSLGFGAGGGAANVAAGEADLDGNVFRPVLNGFNAAEDGWGIFRVTDIFATASDGQLYQIYDAIASDYELTGIFYGIRDFYMHQASPGSGSAFAGQIIDGTSMVVDFWAQDKPLGAGTAFSQTGGPGVRIGEDGYPTITDGGATKVLTLNSTDGFINDDGTFGGVATEFESNTAAVGYAALNVVGGDAQTMAQFDTNSIGFKGTMGAGFLAGKGSQKSTDVWFSFTSNPGTNGWDVNSNDPMLATVSAVPDAGSTLALMACALPVLVAARRRRST